MKDLFNVSGKVALVTGGSRGIGEMIAEGFVANGVRTYISARKAEACDATAARLSQIGDCISIPTDLSTKAGIDALADEIKSREKTLDILVNNAGATWGAPIGEFPESAWDKVMDINVKSPFFLTQSLLPLLEKSASPEDPARVINIGSVDGLKNSRWDNFPYGPSKAAIHHLTRQLGARLVKENIILNAIAPGPFPTWMLSTGVGFGGETEGVDWERVGKNNPRGRVGTAEDIAGLAIYLCSRAGAFTVGETITCDGGATARAV